MRKTLLDTNIVSYFFRGQPIVVERIAQYGQFHDALTFSLLTYYEIKSGLLYRDATTLLARFEELTSESEAKHLPNELTAPAKETDANASPPQVVGKIFPRNLSAVPSHRPPFTRGR